MKKESYCECKWNHPDCFAFDENDNGNCDALSDCDFPGRDDCPFYKPDSEVPDAHLKKIAK